MSDAALLEAEPRANDTKYCNRCEQQLPLTNFYINRDSPDGYNSICKSCKYNTDKERHTLNGLPSDTPSELSLPELKSLLKEHKITCTSHLNKPEIINLLKERGVLPENYFIGRRRIKNLPKVKNPNPRPALNIRNCGRKVELTLIDTGEVHSFPSIYKSAKFLGTFACSVSRFNKCNFKSNADNKIYRINIVE